MTPIQVKISCLKIINIVFTLIYIHVLTVVLLSNSLIFILIKNSFKLIFISVLYATNQNLRSKCIEIKHFASMCTNCTRVQIRNTSRVGATLHAGANVHPGGKFLKRRSHGQKYIRVQIAHMNEALGNVLTHLNSKILQETSKNDTRLYSDQSKFLVILKSFGRTDSSVGSVFGFTLVIYICRAC